MASQQSMDLPRAIEIAVEHHQAGRLADAEALYRQVLRVDSNHFDALHLLGVLAHQSGKHQEAIELIVKATRQNPSAFPVLNNLGLAYQALNDLEEASVCFQKALALKPDYVEALNNLAIVYQAQAKLDEAAALFQKVLSLRPDFAEAHNNLAGVLHAQGKLDEARACYEKALALKPDFAEALFNLARLCEIQGQRAEALAGYQEALLLKPELAEAHFYLGSMLQAQGIIDEAIACFKAALSLKPEYVEAHWALAMSQLALVYGEGDVPAGFRTNFSDALAKLDRWFDASRSKEGFRAVGSQGPFYLAYQEQDNQALLSAYGDLCVRLMQRWEGEQGLVRSNRAPDGPIRVGLVSAHIRDQSVWTAIIKGWCRHLDRDLFSLHVFYTGKVRDQETSFAMSQATSFLQAPTGLRRLVDSILDKQLDVIIFPEVGMDPMTMKVASLHLAPVQMAAWGHPETTGLPTIDYYLSAEDFEPPGAQQYYRERLVALPHLGCCYQPLEVNAVEMDLDALGIDTASLIFVCPGTPYKYAPQHDWVFVEIARRIKKCQFVFFDNEEENLSEKVKQRLEYAFTQSDLYVDEYVVFIPWLSRPAFYGLLRRADIYLDTMGFSGFNTAMQAVECGLPIVTREGRFMRGRLASGILRRMGMPELVAKGEEEYVDLAVKLGLDVGFRRLVRERFESSRHVLFHDLVPVRALEKLLLGVSGQLDPAAQALTSAQEKA
jgi:predicted O-linked N-acetylglucosamine transferase (SPINDLY family)